ncbi:MAG: ribonuclease HI [Bacteroidia bacterium]|jgi:ribonuclease HI|nr:ribonuclease HI [Bacteroidia bacterium]
MAYIDIYTDGSALGNPGPGGYAAVLLSGDRRLEISGGFSCTTNNRMELMAVVEALQALRGNDHTIRLYSDSKYVVDAFVKDWIGGWKRRAWKNVKNIDLWQRLLPLTHQHQITWCWIKGHAEIPENERCDVLAKAAAASSTLGPDLGYRANSL